MSLPKGCGWFTGHAAGPGSRRPCARVSVPWGRGGSSRGVRMHGRPARTCRCQDISEPCRRRSLPALLHAAAQDLVGRDQHHADDEGHGEGADEALAHARLAVLLLGVHCGDKEGSERLCSLLEQLRNAPGLPSEPSLSPLPAETFPNNPPNLPGHPNQPIPLLPNPSGTPLPQRGF